MGLTVNFDIAFLYCSTVKVNEAKFLQHLSDYWSKASFTCTLMCLEEEELPELKRILNRRRNGDIRKVALRDVIKKMEELIKQEKAHTKTAYFDED